MCTMNRACMQVRERKFNTQLLCTISIAWLGTLVASCFCFVDKSEMFSSHVRFSLSISSNSWTIFVNISLFACAAMQAPWNGYNPPCSVACIYIQPSNVYTLARWNSYFGDVLLRHKEKNKRKKENTPRIEKKKGEKEQERFPPKKNPGNQS